jgi:hypothetical protein
VQEAEARGLRTVRQWTGPRACTTLDERASAATSFSMLGTGTTERRRDGAGGEVRADDAGGLQQRPGRGLQSLHLTLDRAAEGFGNGAFDLRRARAQTPLPVRRVDQPTADEMIDRA